MTHLLKLWHFKPHDMQIVRKSVIVSLYGKTISYPSRTISSSSKFLTTSNSNNKDIAVILKESDNPRKEGIGSSQIDQQFLEDIYTKTAEDDLRNKSNTGFNAIDKTEYFRQAWQNKQSVINKQYKFKDTFSEDRSEGKNEFGTLKQPYADSGVSKSAGLRDPNERLQETYPDDKDEKRDWRKNIPLTRYGRRGQNAFHYTKRMTQLSREGKVNEAMEVFDNWMMVQDRVMPSKRTFITLIGIVGRAGYTRKAFQLFRQMKHLGLDPLDQVYTSLFNACANCPMPDYGLKHANSLYQHMNVKRISPHPITVMASMKAFALCGDFPKAFQILDEARIPLDVQCFNALLVACAMDKQSGFRRALKVWQTMGECNFQPAYQTYNLLLRCLRDCGVGDEKTLAADLGLDKEESEISPVSLFKFNPQENENVLLSSGLETFPDNIDGKKLSKGQGHDGFLQAAKDDCDNDISELESSQLSDSESCLESCDKILDNKNIVHSPGSVIKNTKSRVREWCEEVNDSDICDNLEVAVGTQSTVDITIGKTKITGLSRVTNVSLSCLNTKHGRLDMVGGASALISHMTSHGVNPDIKTFTELLSCVPTTAESEWMVLGMMDALGVKPDIDFLNDIMMRRNMRHESNSVKEILTLISELRHTPNMRTYAALALTCHSLKKAQTLLEDMELSNVEPSIEVMSHLLYISRLNFHYKRYVLEKIEELVLKPNSRVINTIEKSIATAKSNILSAEKRPDAVRAKFYLSPKFQRQFKSFLQFYQSWLLRTDLENKEHPWERFTDGGKRSDEALKLADKSTQL